MRLLTPLLLAACISAVSSYPEAAESRNANTPGTTDVGVWYCTYYGDDWTRVGGMGYCETLYKPLCSDKPDDFRRYNAADVSVIDFHLQHLANAHIDFLLFELTPGGLGGYRPSMKSFVDNARIVAQRIKVWNDAHKWKIRYAIAAGSHADVYGSTPIGLCMEKEAEDVYKSFYSNQEYGGPDNYYHLDGKPLLVYWGDINQNTASWNSYAGDKTYGDRFSIRYANEVRSGSYGWNINSSGTIPGSEVEVVSPGWGHYSRAVPPYVSRHLGDFYQNCWRTVLDKSNPKPKIVMIVAFNDYLENTAVWTADTTKLTDADKWYGHDEEMHPWLYWDITVGNINALKGMPSCKIVNQKTGKVLDALHRHNGERPYVWDDVNSASQQWQIVGTGDGLSKIVNNWTGQALDVRGASASMYTDTDSATQQWKIVDLGDGLVKIVSAKTGKVLDDSKGTKGSAPSIAKDTGDAGQRWRIIK